MTAPIKRRLEALEARAAPPWRYIFRREGEAVEQAQKRLGVQPGERVIVLSWSDRDLQSRQLRPNTPVFTAAAA